MASINNIGNTPPVQPIVTNPTQKPASAAAPAFPSATDRLELSGASHLLKALKQNNDVRIDKVAQIKSQIEANAYEDDQKLDTAVDRLLDELK